MLLIVNKYTSMAELLTTMKMSTSALRMLRLVAASTGEKQYAVLNRLVEEEAKRLSLPIRAQEPLTDRLPYE